MAALVVGAVRAHHPGLTALRAWACVMVIAVHVVETFYISPRGELLQDNGITVGLLGSAFRASVPLFVMITGALLLPVRGASSAFLKKRLRRVLGPFFVWSLLYAAALFLRGVYDERTLQKIILLIPFQLSPYVGHLWYVYMLVGLYLLLPILSAWVEKASERELWGGLALWGISLLLPYARVFEPQLFGEAHWNVTSTFYYFSGFIGYLVLGHALARRHETGEKKKGWGRALGIFCLGYLVTCAGFLFTFPHAKNISQLELFWQFDTLNVAWMAMGLFEIGLMVQVRASVMSRWVEKFAAASYAIYLAHLFVLVEMTKWGNLVENLWFRFGVLTVSTSLLTFLIVSLLGKIPQLGKWIGLESSVRSSFSGSANLGDEMRGRGSAHGK